MEKSGEKCGTIQRAGKCKEKGGVTIWDPISPDPNFPDPTPPLDPNLPDLNYPDPNFSDPNPPDSAFSGRNAHFRFFFN